MRKKRSQKNKGKSQQQQPEQQPVSHEPTPGPSEDSPALQAAVSKGSKNRKHSATQQNLQKETDQQQTRLSQQQKRGPQQSTPSVQPASRGRDEDQHQTTQATTSQPFLGAWQRGPPQLQQTSPKQISSSHSPSQQQPGQRDSKGSIASPKPQQQLGTREPHGRGSRQLQQPREPGQIPQAGGPPQHQRQQQVKKSSQEQPPLDSPKIAETVKQKQDLSSKHGSQPLTQKTISKKEEQRTTSQKATLSLDLIIPPRKKQKAGGTVGKKIAVETNHLALMFKKLDPAFHYDVSIEPDKPKRLLRGVMEEFRRINYPNRYPAFDGAKNLYSSPELPFGKHIDDKVTIEENEKPKTFKVTINYAAMVDLSVLSKCFESADEGEPIANIQRAIQCLDVVIRSAPALRLIPVGRSFFTVPRKEINLGEGMQMYYGFYQSAILGWQKPFLNVDVTHKAFPKSLPVIDLIKELCPRSDLQRELSQRDFTTVDRFLRTLKVQYVIPNNPCSRKVMRVNELYTPASKAKFEVDGHETTVEHYFSSKKSYRLQYPNMPCLWMGNKERTSKMLFPVEFCTILEGQVTNRSMTPRQTSSLIKQTATSTVVRKEKIMDGIQRAGFNENECAREFGISVNPEFEKVQARVLVPPELSYADIVVRPQKGIWDAGKFKNVKPLERWCICYVDYRLNDNMCPGALQEFTNMLIQQAEQLGMKIAKPTMRAPIVLQFRKEKEKLKEHFETLKEMQLLLVVIGEQKEVYYNVKQVAELSVGTLTQCVRVRNVIPPKTSTVRNILLKINAKLNGVNHTLHIRPICLKIDSLCMIMGADVTHPSPENKGTVPSVAAVTASHDPYAFQYNICLRLQKSGQEIIADLANMVEEHLRFFYKRLHGKPTQIIFYRDGVSEGQFQKVLNAEVHAIRQACKTMEKDGYEPKITFLVVQKRHHTRFFPTNPNDCDDKRNLNVPAGTVVDTDITHPSIFDFYLVSHASIQGVARPTKYCRLWDDNRMSPDELEELTYQLCHMFTRCTRSVSYPAPTYYAHLAAARGRVYCEGRRIDLNNLQWEQKQLAINSKIRNEYPMFFV